MRLHELPGPLKHRRVRFANEKQSCGCWRSGNVVIHAPACRPGRPLCRWMRAVIAKYAPCCCPAYPWPHRAGSGLCGDTTKMTAQIWGDEPDADPIDEAVPF